jgi:hypothetical protein
MNRSEYSANMQLANAPAAKQTRDLYGASAYDRIGRNALAYAPTLRNMRTAKPSFVVRVLKAICGAV